MLFIVFTKFRTFFVVSCLSGSHQELIPWTVTPLRTPLQLPRSPDCAPKIDNRSTHVYMYTANKLVANTDTKQNLNKPRKVEYRVLYLIQYRSPAIKQHVRLPH